MKLVAILIIFLGIVSCTRFDEDHLLIDSFGLNLKELSKGKKVEYTDGLFLVYDIAETDLLYKEFFTDDFYEGDVVITFGRREFSSSGGGKMKYCLLESFDGFTKTVFYIANQRLLGFGYSDGLM